MSQRNRGFVTKALKQKKPPGLLLAAFFMLAM
jgi:hypothetical protein